MGDNQCATYFVGTAGAGKSTLVAAYDRWCKEHDLSTMTVNLDPGAEQLAYQPDFDIRDAINLKDIQIEHGLGPNGAQVAAADMIALELDVIKEQLDEYRADQILIDTPGQVELFLFRQAGKMLVDELMPGRSVVAYLLDPFLARTAGGFSSQLMLAATCAFRFQAPMLHLLSKTDVLEDLSRDTILKWSQDSIALEEDIMQEEPGMDRELATSITRVLDTLGHRSELIPVSSVDNIGMADIYAVIQSAVGLSEDSTPEYDTFLNQGEEEAK